MERHHRGWKETRLAEDRLLRDLLPGKRQKRSRLPPSSRCPRLTRDNRPPFLPPPIYALWKSRSSLNGRASFPLTETVAKNARVSGGRGGATNRERNMYVVRLSWEFFCSAAIRTREIVDQLSSFVGLVLRPCSPFFRFLFCSFVSLVNVTFVYRKRYYINFGLCVICKLILSLWNICFMSVSTGFDLSEAITQSFFSSSSFVR